MLRQIVQQRNTRDLFVHVHQVKFTVQELGGFSLTFVMKNELLARGAATVFKTMNRY